MTKTTKQPARKSGDLNEIVYTALKDMILSGKLRPGVRLVHQDLADQLKVSRTPVRESLERLYQEGYAGRRMRRGYFVAEVGANEVRDLFGIREALETHALRIVAERGITPDELAELQEINSEYAGMFPASVNRARLLVDQKFHRTLAGFSGNQHLCNLLLDVYERIELKRRLDGHGLIVGNQPLDEHLSFVAALKAGDYTEAEQILRNHIRFASNRLLTHLEANFGADGL